MSDAAGLERFVAAQTGVYAAALAEICAGRKQTHWMWFVFPQLAGLGSSATAQKYAIRDLAEAQAYLQHPLLGARLGECAEAALGVEGRTAHDIFGSPDELKLRSCATLFAQVSPPGSVFERLLEKHFGGQPDPRTLALLEATRQSP
ncbi:MAG: DUF1810 domain-containing protein [Pirellulales bacterium]